MASGNVPNIPTLPPQQQPQQQPQVPLAATGATTSTRPRVLVMGATGKTGGPLLKMLGTDPNLQIIAGVHRQESVAQARAAGVSEVRVIELENYSSYTPFLTGVDYLFMVLPYSVGMLQQGHNIVDIAKEVGVKHVVKLSTFNEPGAPASRLIGHHIWHDLLDVYLMHSGLAWTILQANLFMQSFYGGVQGGDFVGVFGDARLGLVDTVDIAKVAAVTLREPQRYKSKRLYLSTDVLTGHDMARILTDVFGRNIVYKAVDPKNLADTPYGRTAEPTYLTQTMRFAQLASQGKLQDLAKPTNTIQQVTGQLPTHWREFVQRDRANLEGSPGITGLVSMAREAIKGMVIGTNSGTKSPGTTARHARGV